MSSQPEPESVGSSQDAIAFRMLNVEKAIDRFEMKLDGLAAGFATHSDIERSLQQAKLDHDAIYKDIRDIDVRVKDIQSWKDGLIGKVAAGAIIMIVMMVLALYGLDKFVKI